MLISWMQTAIKTYLNKNIHAAPLAVFRILFGLLMLGSLLRFCLNGWVDKLYIQPQFFFSYQGFEWVKPLGTATYLIFIIASIAAVLVSLGWFYRFGIVVFFLSFTYIELMDKTTYLNHYYFVSILSFLMIWLPAHAYYSIDAYRQSKYRFEYVPKWSVDALKLLLTIVYFYAGLAKLNSDWLLEAMPLKIWLTAKYDLPLIGSLLHKDWIHYFFSWSGALYDLSIPFFLWWSKTRVLAFLAVLFFHIMTALLFPIGMFPYIMIVSTFIFFDPKTHQNWLQWLSKILRLDFNRFNNATTFLWVNQIWRRATITVLLLFFVVQITFPFRYLNYPGELFWTEEGFRFSWRVMLMEKAGYAQFKVVDSNDKRTFYVDNSQFLTPLQEKQMSTQPDFIYEYALFLEKYYQNQGIKDPAIYVESYVALNGRPSQPYIDPNVDLTQASNQWPRSWLLPFNDTIYGF